jgi:hypothetical protein
VELSLDWKAYQTAFQLKGRPKPGAASALPASSAPSIARNQGDLGLIVEGPASAESVIVSAFCEGEDSSEWIGQTPQEVLQTEEHAGQDRTLWVYSRAEVEKVLASAAEMNLPGSHYLSQLDRVRAEAQPLVLGGRREKKGKPPIAPEPELHFIPALLASGWIRFFPSSFALYFRIEGSRPEKQYFLVFRRGKLEAFVEPDLSSMNPDRRKDPVEVARYLGKSAGVPTQGLQVSAADWRVWAESSNPWKEVAEAIRGERARLLPFRWPVAVWIGTRALL